MPHLVVTGSVEKIDLVLGLVQEPVKVRTRKARPDYGYLQQGPPGPGDVTKKRGFIPIIIGAMRRFFNPRCPPALDSAQEGIEHFPGTGTVRIVMKTVHGYRAMTGQMRGQQGKRMK
jgi:hypothetical protein